MAGRTSPIYCGLMTNLVYIPSVTVNSDSRPYVVVLAGRGLPPVLAPDERAVAATRTLSVKNPFSETLRRAAHVASRDRVAAVLSEPVPEHLLTCLEGFDNRNLFSQPRYLGTAYEVLISLLHLEPRIPATTPIIFLPSDHVVSIEEVMTCALHNMIEWITNEPTPVYLLGAAPEGPHDELGYILPWLDGQQIPTGVYEFIEKPAMREARRLINAGGLWNTFIFGGTYCAILELFRPYAATIDALRTALSAQTQGVRKRQTHSLLSLYQRLAPLDFSRDLLSGQTDKLNVLRLPPCGWWPLRSPKRQPIFDVRPEVGDDHYTVPGLKPR